MERHRIEAFPAPSDSPELRAWIRNSARPYSSTWIVLTRFLLLNGLSTSRIHLEFIEQRPKGPVLERAWKRFSDGAFGLGEEWTSKALDDFAVFLDSSTLPWGSLNLVSGSARRFFSTNEHFCANCLGDAFHTLFFRFSGITHCPFHREPLIQCCPVCGESINKGMRTRAEDLSLGCKCGLRWFPASKALEPVEISQRNDVFSELEAWCLASSKRMWCFFPHNRSIYGDPIIIGDDAKLHIKLWTRILGHPGPPYVEPLAENPHAEPTLARAATSSHLYCAPDGLSGLDSMLVWDPARSDPAFKALKGIFRSIMRHLKSHYIRGRLSLLLSLLIERSPEAIFHLVHRRAYGFQAFRICLWLLNSPFRREVEIWITQTLRVDVARPKDTWPIWHWPDPRPSWYLSAANCAAENWIVSWVNVLGLINMWPTDDDVEKQLDRLYYQKSFTTGYRARTSWIAHLDERNRLCLRALIYASWTSSCRTHWGKRERVALQAASETERRRRMFVALQQPLWLVSADQSLEPARAPTAKDGTCSIHRLIFPGSRIRVVVGFVTLDGGGGGWLVKDQDGPLAALADSVAEGMRRLRSALPRYRRAKWLQPDLATLVDAADRQ